MMNVLHIDFLTHSFTNALRISWKWQNIFEDVLSCKKTPFMDFIFSWIKLLKLKKSTEYKFEFHFNFINFISLHWLSWVLISLNKFEWFLQNSLLKIIIRFSIELLSLSIWMSGVFLKCRKSCYLNVWSCCDLLTDIMCALYAHYNCPCKFKSG